MPQRIERQPEPEVMDLAEEARVYALADFADVNERFVQAVLQHAGPRERATAVDLGTGPGDILVRLLRERPDWRVVGVDASEAMLAFARRALMQAGRAPMLVMADAKRLPLADRSFDVLLSNSLLHHLPDPREFWIEVKRTARPGGVLVLRDLARPASEFDARRIVRENAAAEPPLLQEEFCRSLLAAFTPEEVRAQLDAAGLHGFQVTMVTDRHLDVSGRF